MILAGVASEEEALELLELDEEDELLELEAGRELDALPGDELPGSSSHPPSVPATDTASAVTPAIFKNSRRLNAFAMTFSSGFEFLITK